MKTEPTEAYIIAKRLFDYEDEPILESDICEIADIAFQEGQSNPKIKQLEWEEDILFADMIVSDGFSLLFYRINIIDNTLYVGDTAKSFNTIEEAKAFAQDDFEARVKECLITE